MGGSSGSHMTGNDVMGIGSGMGNRWPVGKRDCRLREPEVTWFGMGKPLTSGKKYRGLREPEVTWFGVGNHWPGGKKDRRAQRERGLRIQSPIQARGRSVYWKKKDAMLETKNNLFQSECYRRPRGVMDPRWRPAQILFGRHRFFTTS